MDVQNEIKKLRERTGMNRKQFYEYFEIPIEPVSKRWEEEPENASLYCCAC